MKMVKELKPCPFCGGDKIVFKIEGHFKPWENRGIQLWYRCHCYECGAEGSDIGMDTDMNKATKTWNRREEVMYKPEALKPLEGQDIEGRNYKICRYCSTIVEDGEWRASYCPNCGKPVDWSAVFEMPENRGKLK